jgi:heat shock protein HslJ
MRGHLKQIVKLLAVLSGLILSLTACGEGSSVPPAAGASGRWQLESGTLQGEPLPLVPGYRITLTIDGDSVTGRSACNWYGGTIRIDGDNLSFGEIGGTDMGCRPKVMSSEQAYLMALQLVDKVSRHGPALVFSRGDTALRFAPLPPVPEATLIGSLWRLETLIDGDTAVSVNGERPTLEFRDDGSFSGSTGCRKLSGNYVVSGDEVLAAELAAEGRCPASLTDQDGHVVTVLGDGFTVAIDGDQLILTSMGNLGLVYGTS